MTFLAHPGVPADQGGLSPEHEMGMDMPSQVQPTPAADPGFVRIKVENVYGARALIVEGPVGDLAELEAAVDRIMRRLGEG